MLIRCAFDIRQVLGRKKKRKRIKTDESRMKLKIYLWIMGWSGKINSWAWQKQAEIIKQSQRKDEEAYLKELQKKL